MATVYKREKSQFYHANILVGGERRRFSTNERNRREAQKKANEEEFRQNAEHERQQKSEDGSIRLMKAADAFFQMRAKSPKPLRAKTVSGYRDSLANIYGRLGDFPLNSLTLDILEEYVSMRMQEGHAVALRNDLAFLSSLYTSAKLFDRTVRVNIVKQLDKKPIPKAVEHKSWLKPAQVQALLEATTQNYQRLFVLLATLTGMRKSEILQLRWDEVDLDEKVITLANLDDLRTKNGESRLIPIPESLVEALTTERAKQKQRYAYVLVNPRTKEPYTTVKTMWGGLLKRSGLKGVRIHDLRHTYASWSKQHDVDEVTIMAIMGHKTRSMVRRYSHPSNDHLKRSVKKLEAVSKRL